MATPDVTVVVAVYNTMPYLVECLDSLVGQSIGADRLEVVAVDDGSTDDSGEVLDKYAAAYPEIIRVIHQENSGGPAAPSNRALDAATGRYVYFLGADDYLGSEALARMVDFADEHGSDVVIGKMVGVNGRGVHQGMFQDGNVVDLDPYGPKLRWAIANTKLFRRELVEGLGLRYPEDMPFGSDQPYTLAACVHARRISVLADYTCYYAVERDDRSNISFRTPLVDRLQNIRRMMQAVADLVPPGPRRDTLLVRHFGWEIIRLFPREFADMTKGEQRLICVSVREMAREWLSPAILDELPVWSRLRIVAAQRGDLPLLIELVDREVGLAEVFAFEAGHAHAVFPGFESSRLPRRLYRIPLAGIRGRLSALVELRAVRVARGMAVIELRLPMVGPDAPNVLSARLERSGQTSRVADGPDPVIKAVEESGLTSVSVSVPLAGSGIVDAGPWHVVLQGQVEAGSFEVRLPAPGHEIVERCWVRGRPCRVRVTPSRKGSGISIAAERISAREVAAAVLRRIRRR